VWHRKVCRRCSRSPPFVDVDDLHAPTKSGTVLQDAIPLHRSNLKPVLRFQLASIKRYASKFISKRTGSSSPSFLIVVFPQHLVGKSHTTELFNMEWGRFVDRLVGRSECILRQFDARILHCEFDHRKLVAHSVLDAGIEWDDDHLDSFNFVRQRHRSRQVCRWSWDCHILLFALGSRR